MKFMKFDKDGNPVECEVLYRATMPMETEPGKWETKSNDFDFQFEDILPFTESDDFKNSEAKNRVELTEKHRKEIIDIVQTEEDIKDIFIVIKHHDDKWSSYYKGESTFTDVIGVVETARLTYMNDYYNEYVKDDESNAV